MAGPNWWAVALVGSLTILTSAAVAEPPATPLKTPNWVLKKPPRATQTQRSSADRGVNPCNTRDPGWGIYDRWQRGIGLGQYLPPQQGGLNSRGQFDVMFHFHGHEPVRKEWVQIMNGAVLVGIDLGVGSGPYEAKFSDPALFPELLEKVEQAMAERAGRKSARARHIGLSAWSAGYGAVQNILAQRSSARRIDSVILLDGLHSGYSPGGLNDKQLKPFIEFSRQAAGSGKFMFVSHSSIIPPNYASTTETANYLIFKLGGKPRTTRARSGDPMGLELISRYTKGSFHVRGYKGNDQMDHCAHIGLFRDVLSVHIKPRWNSPRGRKR